MERLQKKMSVNLLLWKDFRNDADSTDIFAIRSDFGSTSHLNLFLKPNLPWQMWPCYYHSTLCDFGTRKTLEETYAFPINVSL